VLPPRWVRRVVLAPLMVVLAVAVVFGLPLWLIAAAAASSFVPGRWRPLRVLWMVLVHLVLETYVLVRLALLWIMSGFGRRLHTPAYERRHYDLVETYLKIMLAQAERVLHLEIIVEGPTPADYAGRPLLVFCRHAGPGDSFMIVHFLVNVYDREPRIVLKDTLQWDPAIDVLLNRLPNRFIRPGRTGLEEQIAALARGLDTDDAFVIFPEGGNFTERRRARAIARLYERGRLAEAEKAEQLRNVLAPRTGGVLAALEAAPDADVVWVAHSGLEHVISVADLWRELPMDSAVRMRWWQVPADDVPDGRDARVDWLYAWWAKIDDWIGAPRTATNGPLPGPGGPGSGPRGGTVSRRP
jgi:1-acyl-sn-glycerol-3-phosphate acyltransferase